MNKDAANITQAIPFFMVYDMIASLKYYIEGLGFTMTNKWVVEDKIRWCSLAIGNSAIMLQEFWREGQHSNVPEGKLGQGVSICFICKDALQFYDEVIARGIDAAEPFVGNNMWVTELTDPNGYKLFFESPTDVPEETTWSQWKAMKKS